MRYARVFSVLSLLKMGKSTKLLSKITKSKQFSEDLATAVKTS